MLSKSLIREGALLGVLFFCSSEVLAQNWQDKQWQKILLYRETLTGWESEADTPSFFVHPEGKYSPKKELKAFIESLHNEDPDPKKNSFCRFPARVRWLRKHAEVPESKVDCENYIKFKNRIAAKSLSIVFSSYYLNNPASSFGHTFIRLGKQTNEKRDADSTATELLDTGINYGAVTEGAGPVFFAIGGLAGWFSGNYNAVPYYYKVREYNDFETRDLWSYQLELTQEEIDFIVDYIWELGHAQFDYFFLTENCSYHVLSILEAARPSLALHSRLPAIYTIPSETLKAFDAEDLIRGITFRPAPSTLFYHQRSLLSGKEKEAMSDLVMKNLTPQGFSPERLALIYDTSLSLIDYRYAKEILRGDQEAQKIKRPLLIARSKIPVRSKDMDFSDRLKKAPHLGHGQKRLAVSYVNREGDSFMDLKWRFAFHDVLDNDIGYPPKTSIEVLKGTLRTDGQNLELRELALVDVFMIGKWDIFNQASSWKIKMGHWQTRNDGSDLSTQGFQGGYGYAFEAGPFTPFALAHVETSYISEKLNKFKLGYGGDVGILTEFNHFWKAMTKLEGRLHPWEESLFIQEIRYSNPSFGAGAYYQTWLSEDVKEAGISFFKYF